MGFCAMPLTVVGSLICAASRMVGTISLTWLNWLRNPPRSVIPFGHVITIGLRVPPRCDATVFVHLNGVSIAHAQPTG
ncbi:hypothetical protein D3C76_1623690 [compost metagenome]